MPIDYGAALRGGMAVVPDYAQAEAQQQELQQRQQALSLREQQMTQEVVQQQRTIEREAAWNRDLQAYLANPTTARASELMLRYPDQAENMRKTLESTGTDAARSSLRSMGEIHALATRGDWQGAAALVERRIAADTAAGNPPDEDDAEMVSMLRSGDPVLQNRALGTLRVGIAAAAGPERFTEAYGRLDPSAEPTTTEQQYQFIYRTAGPQAAANFLAKQTDRTAWVEGRGLIQLPDAPLPRGGGMMGGGLVATPDQQAQTTRLEGEFGGNLPTPSDAPAPSPDDAQAGLVGPIMQLAAQAGRISAADAQRVRAFLGPNGGGAFDQWLQVNRIQMDTPAPVRVRTLQEARALPPGTRFIDPTGVERIR